MFVKPKNIFFLPSKKNNLKHIKGSRPTPEVTMPTWINGVSMVKTAFGWDRALEGTDGSGVKRKVFLVVFIVFLGGFDRVFNDFDCGFDNFDSCFDVVFLMVLIVIFMVSNFFDRFL